MAFPTTSLGLHITALAAWGQASGTELPCLLDVKFPARHDISSSLTSQGLSRDPPPSHFLLPHCCSLPFPGSARTDQGDLEPGCKTGSPGNTQPMAFHPSRKEAEGARVPGSSVHTPQRVYMEIPGGSQGSFQFRTNCFIFVPLPFRSLLSPSSGWGCRRRLDEESRPPLWAESQKE